MGIIPFFAQEARKQEFKKHQRLATDLTAGISWSNWDNN
jgi:hypothetical protein